jgi:Flp pilus assembly protein TadG
MKTASVPGRLARLRSLFAADDSGVAYLEFALSLPLFALMTVGGIEISNYVTTKMRVSQVALMVADHVARIGTGSTLVAKTISEKQINDVLTGAGLQSGRLSLYTQGRVIISSVEEDSANAGKYKIAWQRCRGLKNQASSYGNAGANNLTGVGPTGRQVTAPPSGAAIFVQVSYTYQPLINMRKLLTASTEFNEIAAMPVRERRDLTQIYNSEGVSQKLCNQFTS